MQRQEGLSGPSGQPAWLNRWVQVSVTGWLTLSQKLLGSSYEAIPGVDLWCVCIWLSTTYTHEHTLIHMFKNMFASSFVLKFHGEVLKHELSRRQLCISVSKGWTPLTESKHLFMLTASMWWEHSPHIPKYACMVSSLLSESMFLVAPLLQNLEEYNSILFLERT